MENGIRAWLDEQSAKRAKYVAYVLRLLQEGKLNLTIPQAQAYIMERKRWLAQTKAQAARFHGALFSRGVKTHVPTALQQELKSFELQLVRDEISISLAEIDTHLGGGK